MIAAEPNELAVIHIDGPIDIEELSRLGGRLGIPRIPGIASPVKPVIRVAPKQKAQFDGEKAAEAAAKSAEARAKAAEKVAESQAKAAAKAAERAAEARARAEKSKTPEAKTQE
jgi:hypothetical protein